MPALTRRRYPERQDCWHIYFGDVHVGTIARRIGQPCDQEAWQWQCGFYPGSGPDEQRSGTGPSAPISRWRGRSSRPVARRPTTRHGAISGIGQLGNTRCESAASGSRLKRSAGEVRNQPPLRRSRESRALPTRLKRSKTAAFISRISTAHFYFATVAPPPNMARALPTPSRRVDCGGMSPAPT